ncbi:MAG: Fur family transcriptional regulator, peroxide stress response regulator [Blastocatellia bacterium]|jgi:Fe2+ or Zn2+ uptake regulation protein|nr:Fur family transcriptional regulator, peroxide stress response regulator [Blastocatellia bacterium]
MAKDTGDRGGVETLTPQRETVLRVIQDSENHLTASEIFEAARRLRPTISYATVYNSLRYLKDSGLIHEIQFGNGASRYDRETTRHDHAMCTRCGKLVDFDLDLSKELMRAAARRSGFKAQAVRLTLHGLCPVCRSQP